MGKGHGEVGSQLHTQNEILLLYVSLFGKLKNVQSGLSDICVGTVAS
jgi:hypothetical protein